MPDTAPPAAPAALAASGATAPPVYADLPPERVLDALDAVGLRGDGRILQLNSYENRVFQLFLEDGSAVVAKFYRPGRWSDAQILEEHRFSLELADAEIPVVAPLALIADPDAPAGLKLSGDPPTLAELPPSLGGYRYAITPRRAGRAPELDDPDVLRWIGRFLGRMHAIGAREPFLHRLTIGPKTLGHDARDWLLSQELIPHAARPVWEQASGEALAAVERCFADAGDVATIRLHGDCHPGNLLWTTEGPHFVDLDDAGNGPAVQDLWMLLSGDRAAMRRQLDALLEGYEAFRDFDDREWGLVEALRTLRMIHHSAWIARRWSDPAFPVAFPFFEGAAYWQQQSQQLREQLEAMAGTERPW